MDGFRLNGSTEAMMSGISRWMTSGPPSSPGRTAALHIASRRQGNMSMPLGGRLQHQKHGDSEDDHFIVFTAASSAT